MERSPEDTIITFDELRERLRQRGQEAQFDAVACSDWREKLAGWAHQQVAVAFVERADGVSPFVFSALMRGGPEECERVLCRWEWDVDQTIGQPSIITYGGLSSDGEWSYDDGQWELSRTSDVLFRPLVLSRYFDGPEIPRFELAQEFELFVRGTWDGDELQWFDEAGDRHVASHRFDTNERRGIEVAEHELRDYLAVTGLSLVRFSEYYKRVAIEPKGVLGDDERLRVRAGTSTSLVELLITTDQAIGKGDQLWVSMHTKEILGGYSRPTSKQFNEHDEGYEKFEVGRDDEGREIQVSCGPSSKDFLVPVMFRGDVLGRYQQEPSKFEVRHQQVKCHGLWSLTFDQLADGKISVFLGDLGHIPRKEQRHWRAFNLPEQGRISQSRYETTVLAKWPSSPTADPPHEFKESLETASAAGTRLLGKHLFRPLEETDNHLRDGLHVPATNEAKELDTQVQAMAKMVGDSIDVKAIKKASGLRISKDGPIKGSLDLLESWLKQLAIEEREVQAAMEPMRFLQKLRSNGTAHRRGSDYLLLLRQAGLEDLNNIERVRRIMVAVAGGLAQLGALLDKANS